MPRIDSSAIKLHALPPYRVCELTNKIWGQAHIPEMGEVELCDVRGWGYLTGGGQAALNLPRAEAMRIQDGTAARMAEVLSTHIVDDGRPMTTDAFLVKLRETMRGNRDLDHYDAIAAIDSWLDGAWDEALEALSE